MNRLKYFEEKAKEAHRKMKNPRYHQEREIYRTQFHRYAAEYEKHCQAAQEQRERGGGPVLQPVFWWNHGTEKASSTLEDCLECYGTGFRSGFGMPCSKGCSSG